MPKKKAPPDRGQRLLTLEELAAELRAIGVRPERVLGMALAGERIARSIVPFDPVKALEKDVMAIYSLRVLDALVHSSDWARMTVDEVAPQRKKHSALVREAARVMTAQDEEMRRNAKLIRAGDVLALVLAHEALADELEARHGANASREAWSLIARRMDVPAATLRDRVTQAKKTDPSLPWPKLKRRGRKAW